MRPVLIDSNNLCYMALHSTGELSYRDMQTGVVFGFFRILLSLANAHTTNRFHFCWDSRRSVRRLKYPDYKKKRRDSRNEMTEKERERYFSMVKQARAIRTEILPRLGFNNNFLQAGYESDDIMAEIVKRHRDKWLMVTADNDMYQCLDFCDIYNPQTKKTMTAKAFKKKYGIKPNQWAQAKAIGGCDSDGVQGVVGVADPKSPTSKALKYIQGTLSKGKIFDRIEESDEMIDHNLKLVALPMAGTKEIQLQDDDLELREEEMEVLFDELGFRLFLREFDKWHIFIEPF